MELVEETIHSFVIRMWLEEPAASGDEAIWRGRITHIPSNQHRYLENLEEIIDFVATHLRADQ